MTEIRPKSPNFSPSIFPLWISNLSAMPSMKAASPNPRLPYGHISIHLVGICASPYFWAYVALFMYLFDFAYET